MNEQKRLIMYFSKGCIEPVVFYKRMAALKSGIPTGEEVFKEVCQATINGNAEAMDSTQAHFASEAKALSTFLSEWQIGENAFNENVFTEFTDSVRIDSRSQVTFCLKCGLALSERI